MRHLTHFLVVMLYMFIPGYCMGQVYNMPAGTTTTCSGTFYDPGGTANYTDLSPTTYVSTFTAGSGDQLYMLFNSIALEGNDKLYIYDGPTTASTLVAVFDYTTLFGKALKSTTGSSITFEFITDGNGLGASGWSISLYCITQPDALNILTDVLPSVVVPCGGRTDFYDPGGFYNNYASTAKTYTTTYSSAAGQRMMFYFYTFFTSFNDVLKIYDGNSTASPLIGTYQGFKSAFSFTTSGDAVTFEFTVNGDAFTSVGWEAMATCINQVNLSCGTSSTYYDPSGSTKQYLSSYAGEDFITTYSVPAGQYIQATINNFYVSGNFTQTYLKVYDGPSAGSPLIATFSILNFPSSFSLSSSGNSLTFSLETSYPSGCVANYDVIFNCTSSQQGSLFTIGGSSSPMAIPCGVASKVYSLGGTSAYPETWLVPGPYIQTYTVPSGQYIQLVCDRMYAATGDFINIYDGTSTSSPLIASYSSPNNYRPLKFTSSSNAITIEIKTDGSASLGGQGIIADITCVSTTGPNNFSLGNSAAPVNTICNNGSTFEDNYGVNSYVDNAVQNYTTTYTEVNGNPLYFVFSSFFLTNGDTLYAYKGTTTSSPLLGKYYGTRSAFSVGSDAGSVTFQFKSNGINDLGSSGWNADISCDDPLPINFIEFKAILKDESVKLEWIISDQINNDYFVVERSNNGKDFIPFDTIKGSGNYTGKVNFSCIDFNPFKGTSYYRLKQVDLDGQFSFSKMQSVTAPDNSYIKVYPQPAEDKVILSFSRQEIHKIEIQLVDKVGRVILTKEETDIQNNEVSLDLSCLLSDIYILVIKQDGNIFTQKIYKK